MKTREEFFRKLVRHTGVESCTQLHFLILIQYLVIGYMLNHRDKTKFCSKNGFNNG